MFSGCPHFGSEFTVQALINFQCPGWKKVPFHLAIRLNQGHAELFVHYPGGLQFESWHLWTLSAAPTGWWLSEVERLPTGDFQTAVSQPCPHFGEHSLLVDQILVGFCCWGGHTLCFRCDGLGAVEVSSRTEVVPSPVVGLAQKEHKDQQIDKTHGYAFQIGFQMCWLLLGVTACSSSHRTTLIWETTSSLWGWSWRQWIWGSHFISVLHQWPRWVLRKEGWKEPDWETLSDFHHY